MPEFANESTPVLRATGLTKFYGRIPGALDISLQVEPGEIFGLLGPNGSGKTTVLRSALGLLRPTSGDISLFGDSVHTFSDLNHERVGYLPGEFQLWRGLTARKVSDLFGTIGGNGRDRTRRDEIAVLLDLDLELKIHRLSMGNRQKVGLLLALQHDPDLLILDEPTNGLDPLVRRTLMDLLTEFAKRGGSIFYSSHNLNEVEEICSRVAILRKGRLVAQRTIEEIRSEREQRLEFRFAPGVNVPDALPPELTEASEKFRLRIIDAQTWQVGYRGSPSPLLRWLAAHEIAELSTPAISLEEAFLAYYEEDLPATARQGESPEKGGA